MSKAEKKKIVASMYDVIRHPIVTEKAQLASEQNKVVFLIAPDATKAQVKQAVEALFGVDVVKVNIMVRKGKEKRFRNTIGRQNNRKRAIVTVGKNQQIDVSSTL